MILKPSANLHLQLYLGPELELTFWRSPVRLGARWSVMIARRGARVLAMVPAILPTSTLPYSQQH